MEAVPAGYVGYEEKAEDYFSHPREDVAAHFPKHARTLLDVGCGGGAFGGNLMRLYPGLEVWGIEPVPEHAARAALHLTKVIESSMERALPQLPDRHFDCISFNDSLEHVENPWNVLRAVRPKLSGTGGILASIPNLRFYPVMKDLMLRGDFRYTDQGVLDSTHLRFFTRKSMQRLFEDSGYRVEMIEGTNWRDLPLSLRILNRLSHRALDDMRWLQFVVWARPVS